VLVKITAHQLTIAATGKCILSNSGITTASKTTGYTIITAQTNDVVHYHTDASTTKAAGFETVVQFLSHPHMFAFHVF
jgi:hypothetical protein